MKKDIEWLLEYVEEEYEKAQEEQHNRALKNDFTQDQYLIGKKEAFREVFGKINQLDDTETVEQTTRLLENVLKENKRLGKLLEEKHEEWLELMDLINTQETLSEYWIEQKSIDTHVDTLNGEIQATFILDDLKELLVPKQEITFEQAYEKLREESILSEKSFDYYWNCINDNVEIDEPGNLLVPKQELPVIPQFVADWLEEYKEDELIITAGTVIGNRRFPKDTKVAKWLNEDYVRNSEVFAQAWLAYPNIEVEEEQKYRVLDGNTTLLGRINGLILTTVEILEYYPEYDPTFEFTEQEIKDYDPRYMTFAKPVEELKE